MSAGELLGIEPLELKFPFELKKLISCSLQLSNKTDSCVAFKVKTTNPKKYCVRPNTGIVLPRSTCDVIVTMQAQREAPPDMQCKDKFLLQSAKTIDGTTAKNITAEMFNKESGNVVEECKLRVVYVSPPQPPSPVTEWSVEGSPPRDSVLEDGNVARATVIEQIEGQEKSAEVLGHDYLKDPLNVIDPGNFPMFLGGNCMCSDYWGCLVSDRGPWHEREILEILEAVLCKDDPFDDGEDGGSALDESWSFNNKIRALKAVVKEAETKLESMESIVEDTKMVMKSLTHLIEGLNK